MNLEDVQPIEEQIHFNNYIINKCKSVKISFSSENEEVMNIVINRSEAEFLKERLKEILE